MVWFGRLHFVRNFDPLFGAMSLTCYKYFSTKCSWLVSSLGRCRDSFGRLTCGCSHPSGYKLVQIHGHNFAVHRLVAFAFLGPPTEYLAFYVHHRDGDSANNSLDNLMYVTHSQNVQSSYDQNPEQAPGRWSCGAFRHVEKEWSDKGLEYLPFDHSSRGRAMYFSACTLPALPRRHPNRRVWSKVCSTHRTWRAGWRKVAAHEEPKNGEGCCMEANKFSRPHQGIQRFDFKRMSHEIGLPQNKDSGPRCSIWRSHS